MRTIGAIAFLLALPATALAQDARVLSPQEKQTIRQGVTRELRDPSSAQFRWNPERLDDALYCGFVNSKNAYGGYAGFKLFMVLLTREGEFFKADIADGDDIPSQVIREMCAKEGYNIDAREADDDHGAGPA